MKRKSIKGKMCSVQDCDAPPLAHAGELPACSKHYHRWLRHGTFKPSHLDRVTFRTKTPGYNTYRLMISRCHNKKAKDYHRYGGKGIFVCDRWRFGENDKSGFDCFHDDMGDQPKNHSIDRIDNTLGYEPANCRWADQYTQARNKTNNYFPSGTHAKEFCEAHGVNYGTFRRRMSLGQSLDQALRKRERRCLVDNGKPLTQIAKESGVPYRTLVDRWDLGLRGEELLRPRESSKKRTEKNAKQKKLA